MTTHYAVILQYPGDGQLEENRVEFFDGLSDAVSWRDGQKNPDLKVFRIEPVPEADIRSTVEETLARMRRNATPEGGPELLVHLLTDKNPATGLWNGYACDPSGKLCVPMYQRTTTPHLATCPDCLTTLGGAR